ncbi:recombinase family protein [Sphingomonas sp. CFBP 13728]|uniref:recombinase family protein n=1 Tax=Sphingomonas sp. CFBP 13728 TaxID=2775294 RepID=UPI00177E34B8|nr:recombinase family protein [Sphingomonas sp. CFBP 13728]MBD8619739.1 recombinase family protein [Sphingomonas sp. CFBP 13728]
MIVGYARVSTTDQDLAVQIAALTAQGCEKIFSEKRSGTNTQRDQLSAAMDFVREGDTLLVTRLDRFARSAHDLHSLVHRLIHNGVGFRCTEQGGVDTTTSSGKLMLSMLGAVAEFETEIRKERQLEGIAAAKARGVYKGRQRATDSSTIRAMLDEGMKPGEVARSLGVSRMTVHRAKLST